MKDHVLVLTTVPGTGNAVSVWPTTEIMMRVYRDVSFPRRRKLHMTEVSRLSAGIRALFKDRSMKYVLKKILHFRPHCAIIKIC